MAVLLFNKNCFRNPERHEITNVRADGLAMHVSSTAEICLLVTVSSGLDFDTLMENFEYVL